MNYRDEILQAINAADEALYCLDQARKQLLSARNWGIFDIFGGGMVATFIKRRKMSEAKAYAKDARESLMKLKDELDDIDDVIEVLLGNNENMYRRSGIDIVEAQYLIVLEDLC